MSLNKGNLEKYKCLIREMPNLFSENELLEIETDIEALSKYQKENGICLGVAYESDYHYLLVDLIRDKDKGYYTYERLVAKRMKDAVVIVPKFNNKFVLLKQFRHTLRDYQLAFPRGFGEGLSAEENAKKEIKEELGAEIISKQFLGEVVADSGICGTKVNIFFAEISEPKINKNYEGIVDLFFLTDEELKEKIKINQINDGFSLSALALLESL